MNLELLAWEIPVFQVRPSSAWERELESGEVVVYCVRGGSVSRSVQEKLRENNVKVRFIEGGLEAWKKVGKLVKNP